MSRIALPLLVRLDLLHHGVVLSLIIFDGNLSGHTSDCGDTALVAGFDEEGNVGSHEGDGHGHVRTVGENEVGVHAHLLDEREDICEARRQNVSSVTFRREKREESKETTAHSPTFHSSIPRSAPSTRR